MLLSLDSLLKRVQKSAAVSSARRVVIVVVHIDAIAFPFPVAAAVEVVIGHNPVRIVKQHHAPGAVVDPLGDEYFSHMSIPAVGIGASGADSIVVGIPLAIVATVAVLVPALVFTVVVVIAFIVAVLFPSFMLPVVVAIVAVPLRRRNRQSACQSHEQNAR